MLLDDTWFPQEEERQMSRAMTEGDVGPCMTMLLQKKCVDVLCNLGQSDVRIGSPFDDMNQLPSPLVCPAPSRDDGSDHQLSSRTSGIHTSWAPGSPLTDHRSYEQANHGVHAMA